MRGQSRKKKKSDYTWLATSVDGSSHWNHFTDSGQVVELTTTQYRRGESPSLYLKYNITSHRSKYAGKTGNIFIAIGCAKLILFAVQGWRNHNA